MNYLTNEELQSSIIDVGYKYGLELHSNNRRIKNPNNIKSDKFIELLESIGYNDIIVTPPKTGNNTSSVFNAYEFNDGNRDRIITLADNISGRGTNQTRYQELSFLLMLSSYQMFNDEYNIINNMKKPIVYDKIIDDGKTINKNTVNDMIMFLNDRKSWYDSTLIQIKKMNAYLNGKLPLYYVRDHMNFPLNQTANLLFESDISSELRWDINKWNPSDVWLIYNKNIPNFESLTDLNNYLYRNMSEIDGIIGISLKKGDGNISRINAKEPKPSTNGFKLKYGKFFTQNLYTLYEGKNLNGTSVIYRIFRANSNELIRGEVEQKQSNAAHGKVYLNFLSHIDNDTDIVQEVESVLGDGTLEYKNNKYNLTSIGKERFNIVSNGYKNIKRSSIDKIIPTDFDVLLNEGDFMNKINTELQNLTKMEVKKKISARFQTIVLGSYFARLYDKDKEYLMDISNKILLYAKSMSDWSAPHLKIE